MNKEELNYFGKPYITVQTNLRMKHRVRRALKLHEFNVVMVSDTYMPALVQFVIKYYRIDDLKKLEEKGYMFALPIYVTDNANGEMYLENTKIIIQPNELVRRKDLESFFMYQLEKVMGVKDYQFGIVRDEYFAKVAAQTAAVRNSMITSFDDAEPEPQSVRQHHTSSSSPVVSAPDAQKEIDPTFLPPLSLHYDTLSREDLQYLFPVYPQKTDMSGFYRGMQEYFSQQSEIAEAVARQVN